MLVRDNIQFFKRGYCKLPEQSEDSVSERYDPLRGEMVIKYARDFLDKYFPIKNLREREKHLQFLLPHT